VRPWVLVIARLSLLAGRFDGVLISTQTKRADEEEVVSPAPRALSLMF
jgi:hypothetical protein